MPKVNTYPLTHMQQGMLFNYLNADVPGQDVEQILGQVEPDLSHELFESAWRMLLERHSGLRATFNWRDAEFPTQSIGPLQDLDFKYRDWGKLAQKKANRRLEDFLWEDRRQSFDLQHGPVMRFVLISMPDGALKFLWSFHHILIDGRSFSLLLSEVFEIYAELRGERNAKLATAVPFSDFVSWQQNLDYQDSLPFWRDLLAGFRSPTVVKLAGADNQQADRGFGAEHLKLSAAVTAELRALAKRHDVGLSTIVQAAWGLLLSRYSGSNDVIFGVTRACRGGPERAAGSAPGIYINTLPARIDASAELPIVDWLRSLRQQQKSIAAHEHTPLVDVQRCSELPPGQGLFDSIVVYDKSSLDFELNSLGDEWASRHFELLERPGFPLALYAYGDSELLLRINYESTRGSATGARRMLSYLETALTNLCDPGLSTVGDIAYLPATEIESLHQLGMGPASEIPSAAVHQMCADRAAEMPDQVALVAGAEELTWRELDERANAVAARLQELGAGPEQVIGLCTDRSVDLVVALLGILKTGAAYLPLDPDFPPERLAFMVKDSAAKIIVAQTTLRNLLPGNAADYVLIDTMHRTRLENFESDVSPAKQLAYLIYTSGSTGEPKGVMVEHGNLNNFMTGMDEIVGADDLGIWLAVTSLSFDISVLELLWTLSRGFKVVLFAGETVGASSYADVDLDFGLFYFAAGGSDNAANRYRLLLEGASFADQNGFDSVWTPERHFHDFGGLYPNPVVAAAGLATITENIAIRAGSVVLPLHNPIRVAEDWALVDNLSNGRVGMSIASGWHPNDFSLAPENYSERKQVMIDSLQTVRKLWRGDSVEVTNGAGQQVSVSTLPRPVQQELPIWVTTAGNIETYREAGRQGANVLTHLLGQSVDEVAEKVAAYRRAYKESGAAGRGQVTLMLHTFVGEDTDAIREIVREPMVNYLRSSASLVKNFVSSWTAYRGNTGRTVEADGDEFSKLSAEDMDDLLNFAFERYFETSGLFGSEERCMDMLRAAYAADVDEIACLIDFGVDDDLVLQHLNDLSRVRQQCRNSNPEAAARMRDVPTIPELITAHDATHMQCTPSLARMLMIDPAARATLETLQAVLVGGEAFPSDLAAELAAGPVQRVVNMYGPTEATIWSSTHDVTEANGSSVPIGRPITNTELLVLDEGGNLLPQGVSGELYIGGAGVARGYLDRPELTAEKFIQHPQAHVSGQRLYRTGDLVRWRDDGTLDYLGRTDFQVKIRGHRIELGEIEACLIRHSQVADGVVAARTDASGNAVLVAWVVAAGVERPDVDTILTHLAAYLPDYMLPSSIVYMDALPLTPNRKVDRKALPDPGVVRPELAASFVPPQTELEEILAEIWMDLLRVDRVGRLDNYFKLGGHSLSAVQLAFRIREQFGIDIPMRAFFTNPSLKGLAATIEQIVLEQVDDDDLLQIMSDGDAGPA